MYQMKWPLFTLSLFLLLLLSACGTYDQGASDGEGSISFSITLQDAPTLAPTNGYNLAPQLAPLDCAASGVSTVSATVYDSLNNSIATGGPWSCLAHSGTITNVPAGSGMKVAISGVDTSGNAIYKGEISGITVTAGQTTSTGEIIISRQGTVTTIAGSAGFSGSTDGIGSTARFNFPFGITTDGTNLFIVDNGNNTIRKVVISTGTVTTIAGSAGLSGSTDGTGSAARFLDPTGIATDGTNLFVADFSNHTIRKIVISTGVVTTIAGSAGLSGSTDGTGTAARFNNPHTIATDGTNLFVTDSTNHTIRKIVISTGAVTTITGSAGLSGATDGTGTAARFYTPRGITTDGTNLFVADSWNNTIRKIVISTRMVSTIAGTAGSSGSTDGTGTAARFDTPNNLTTDGTNVFVADSFNNTIRKIVISTGAVTTIAGSAGLSGSTDGTGSAARFDHPDGITISGTNLYATDYNNHTIRKIQIGGASTDTTAPSNTTSANLFINSGATSTSSTTVTLSISASDSVGVTGYYITGNSTGITPTTPTATAAGWTAVTSTTSYSNTTASYTFTGAYTSGTTVYVYVWFKDTAGNVSAVKSDSITYSPTDVTAPSNTTLTNFISSGALSTSLTSVALSISATDGVGVTGYYVTDNSTGITPTTPTATAAGWTAVTSTTSYSNTTASYTFTGAYTSGTTVYVYVWFKDAAGNVSAVTSDTISYSPPASNTWTTKASMTTARAWPGAGTLNGALYVVGGYSGASEFGTLEVYNPTTDTWATKTSMGVARHQMAVGVINGLIYVAGGYSSGIGARSTLEAYDPLTDTWTTKTSMSVTQQTRGAVVNGILYVVGGETGGFCTSTVQAYDPATNTWSTKASMPTARCHIGVVANNSLIYAIGGTNTSGNIYYTNVEVYDPTTNTWTTKAVMPTGRSNLYTDVVNGIIYAVGGTNSSGQSLSTIEAYDPTTNTWTTKAAMSTARNSLAMGVVGSTLYAVGGNNSIGQALTTLEAYTP